MEVGDLETNQHASITVYHQPKDVLVDNSEDGYLILNREAIEMIRKTKEEGDGEEKETETEKDNESEESGDSDCVEEEKSGDSDGIGMIVSRCWILGRARKESEKRKQKRISELRFVFLFLLNNFWYVPRL